MVLAHDAHEARSNLHLSQLKWVSLRDKIDDRSVVQMSKCHCSDVCFVVWLQPDAGAPGSRTEIAPLPAWHGNCPSFCLFSPCLRTRLPKKRMKKQPIARLWPTQRMPQAAKTLVHPKHHLLSTLTRLCFGTCCHMFAVYMSKF